MTLLSRLFRAAPTPPTESSIDIDGRTFPVMLRVSAASNRMTLRYDAKEDRVVVVRPKGVPVREALAFVAERKDWLRARLAAVPPRVPFADGVELPLLGVPHVIRHRPEARRGVWAEDGEIGVSGLPEHLPRRLGDWLKARARTEITPRAHDLAARLGRPVGRISLRDGRTRWGSCTSAGDLSFSWRLVLAPEAVLHYVVAHEVAHLIELNHSHRFWKVVRDLNGDATEARHWLKLHGTRLHRYG
ncbi:MAG: SprT family zinc-dependent metalloprotease [Rhodospirillaceae bacterium]